MKARAASAIPLIVDGTFPVELLLPFAKPGLAAKLREEGAVLSEEYVPEGLRLSAQVDERLYAQVKDYQIS